MSIYLIYLSNLFQSFPSLNQQIVTVNGDLKNNRQFAIKRSYNNVFRLASLFVNDYEAKCSGMFFFFGRVVTCFSPSVTVM